MPEEQKSGLYSYFSELSEGTKPILQFYPESGKGLNSQGITSSTPQPET
jgi:hypothetical protein